MASIRRQLRIRNHLRQYRADFGDAELAHACDSLLAERIAAGEDGIEVRHERGFSGGRVAGLEVNRQPRDRIAPRRLRPIGDEFQGRCAEIISLLFSRGELCKYFGIFRPTEQKVRCQCAKGNGV